MRFFSASVMALLLSTTAHSGLRFDPVSVHPANPQSGQPILLLVRSSWNDGCGGTLDVRANPDRIDITQIANQTPGVGCTTALVPYDAVINPQDSLAANSSLARRVEVRFFRRNINSTDELLDTDIVEFASTAPRSTNIASGSFSSRTLDISGLFLDQQEGVVSTLLSDYDEQGRSSWRFGAGKMHGNVYIGELSRYQQIRCITAPCPRAVANAVGKINMIALGPNELFVNYRNALGPDVSGNNTYHYERLVFNRDATLPGSDSLDSWIPDLVGEWLIGVTGDRLTNADFKRYRISYIGRPLVDPNSFDRRFNVVSATNRSDFFEIICRDARPVDGDLRCNLNNYRALQQSCSANFEPSAVTLGNLRVGASCGSLETEFVMQRLSR